MEITTFCTVISALRVLPDRAQFFQYEALSLSCGWRGNFGCSVKKNTSTHTNYDCANSGDRRNESSCSFDALYPTDTGVYWCESAAGERSDAVSITVTGGSVILEGPALPVTEGDGVTLTCRAKTTSSSSLMADFYKDGVLVRRSSTANMTIPAVSEADEGAYKCSISGAGESPDSRLTVRGHPDLPANMHLPLPVVVAGLSLVAFVSLVLLYIWRSHRGRGDPDVPYADVTITQEVPPRRTRDMEVTFYATIKPGNT